jgi:hypothetical protein
MITVNFINAIKVQFLKPIFEDDFVEKGMKAWLTDIEWESECSCYRLYFDFSEFENENDKYLKASYYPNIYTKELEEQTGRTKFTAKEANMYLSKYSVLYSCEKEDIYIRDDQQFLREIKDYLLEL